LEDVCKAEEGDRALRVVIEEIGKKKGLHLLKLQKN